jgi:HD superfamily phosphohydrolase
MRGGEGDGSIRGLAGVGFGDDPIWQGLDELPRPRGWGSYQDPVMGYLSLPPLLRQAMDLRAVQRLRSIRQLSELELVYPGATNTRFEHSVGVMWLAGLAHDALLQKALQRQRDAREPRWPQLGLESKLAVMLAGLLHDVGHGPYSHTHEMYREREAVLRRHHADRSFTLIKDDNEEIQLFLLRIYARLHTRPLADLVLPSTVATLVLRERLDGPIADWSFLGGIVNGTFDVDRLDYLRRDAFHTGVPVGVDPGEIIGAYTLARVSVDQPTYLRYRNERPTTDADPKPESDLTWDLMLEAHAAPAIERMLSTRDTAYRKLYYHPTHRAVQEMLILGMQRVTNRAPEHAGTDVEPSNLDTMTDGELMAAIGNAGKTDALLRELYIGLRDRRLYEALGCVIRVEEWPQAALNELDDLRKGGNVRLRQRMREVAEEIHLELGGDHPLRILVDVTKTPVEDELAYRRRYLWEDAGQRLAYLDENPTTNPSGTWRSAVTGFSLLERLPHLTARHGVTFEPAGGLRDHHHQYVRQIQELLFFVPAAFLNAIHATLREATDADRDAVAEREYAQKLAPIVRGLWSLLADKFQPSSAAWDPSFERAATELRAWLRSDAFPKTGSRRT